jgi:hypothetical protein
MSVNTELHAEETSSRFVVLETPSPYPGCCCVCGAVDRPVVDFGVDIDWEHQGVGRALFCVFCIKQAASKFPDDKPTDPDVITYKAHREALTRTREEIAGELRDLADRFNSGSPAIPLVPTYGSFVPASEPTDVGDGKESESDEPESSGVSVEADEPVVDEGSDELSSSSDDGSSGLFKFN